jgi:hypothetical protein
MGSLLYPLVQSLKDGLERGGDLLERDRRGTGGGDRASLGNGWILGVLVARFVSGLVARRQRNDDGTAGTGNIEEEGCGNRVEQRDVFLRGGTEQTLVIGEGGHYRIWRKTISVIFMISSTTPMVISMFPPLNNI